MDNMYRVTKYIVTFITWFCVIFVWLLAGFTVVPKMFQCEPYVVMSGSMEPVIPTGSLVYTCKIDELPDVGDIVAYQKNDGMPTLHRIVKYNAETGTFTTKGDANDTLDGEITVQQMIGTYKLHIPKLGFLFGSLEANSIMIGNVMIPALIPILIGIILLLNLLRFLFGYILKKRNESYVV